MKHVFSSEPLWGNNGLGIVRIVVGLLIVYHGHEIFRPELMKSYTQWEMFKGEYGLLKVYVGKSSEFVAGILLTLGWFTRIGSVILVGTLSYITFFVGNGRFWYEDQHPFMFVLFGILFLTMGPGAFSLDGRKRN